MKSKIMAVGLVCSPLLLTNTAFGADSETRFNFSGFGTLAATHSNSREADYLGSIVQPSGPGRSEATSFGVDSKLGLQASANFGNGLSAVLQVISDHRSDGSYRPEVEWANLKYDINQQWSARLGRVVAPVFMVSEYRNVGFAQTPVRQPYDVYTLNPITRLDGLDVAAKFDVADGVLGAQVVAGRPKLYVPNVKVTGSAVMGNVSYEIGSSTYRIGYGKYNLQLLGLDSTGQTFEAYDSYIRNFGALLGYPLANVRLHDVGASNLALGYAYDSGKWLAQAEYVQSRGDGVAIQDRDSWYVLGGYRIGKFTPYASYSRMKSKEAPISAIPTQTLPAGSFGGGLPAAPITAAAAVTCAGAGAAYMSCLTAAGTINGVDGNTNVHNEQSTLAFGVRYDFYKNMALKAQYEHIRKPATPATNRGSFDNATATWDNNAQNVNLLTVALDFVF